MDIETTDMTNADAVDRLAKSLAAKAKEIREDQRRAEREAARAKAKTEAEAHYAKMYDEIGQPLAGLNKAQHGIVYSMAYDQGHSSGFAEVESYYDEFAEMARKLLASN
jgi:hypothetical protein